MPTPHFKKGQSGNSAGRPKGVKNKLSFNVGEICAQNNCNPFEVLVKIANGTLEKLAGADDKKGLTMRLRMEAAAELAQYIAPKLKSIEHSGNSESPVQFIMNLGENVNV